MKNTQQNCGLLYCAVGTEYFNQAVASYKTVLSYTPQLRASIYTDGELTDSIWEQVISPKLHYVKDFNNKMGYKLDSLISSPYDKTLFLDSDTLVLDDLEELFDLLDKFDLVLCHGHNRSQRYRLISNARNKTGDRLFPDSIPYSFSPLQSGLILRPLDRSGTGASAGAPRARLEP